MTESRPDTPALPSASPVLALAPEQRRVLVVTSEIRQISRAEQGALIGKAVGTLAGSGAALTTGMLWLVIGLPAGWAGGKVGKAFGWAGGKILDMRAGNVPPLKSIPRGWALVLPGDAQQSFAFPAGHPVESAAYVLHPLDSRRYLPVELFHPTLFQEKADDLLRLLAGLGATTIKIRVRRGTGASGSLAASVKAEEQCADASATSKYELKHSGEWEERFPGNPAPRVPQGLLWLESEPSWQEIVRRRLEFGLKSARASLSYDKSYNVDFSLKAELESLGLKVGASFKEFESTCWDLDVSFL